jgi:hypothetical protein
MMAVLHEDSFDVFPLREDYRCTPQSVASHTLYENADPFELKEPSGTLRTNNARYEGISDCAVRVSGSQFVHDPEYTIKLEGVRQVGCSTILMGGVRDPYILVEIDSWLAQLGDNIKTRIRTRSASGLTKSSPASTADGVMGALEPQRASVENGWICGHEALILYSVGRDQRIAGAVPHDRDEPLAPRRAQSDSQVARIDFGRRLPLFASRDRPRPVYEFHLNHLLLPESPTTLFGIEYQEL